MSASPSPFVPAGSAMQRVLEKAREKQEKRKPEDRACDLKELAK